MDDKWDTRLLSLAFEIATWSKDPSTKTGAVIVNPDTRQILATGYNGFPRRVDDTEWLLGDRTAKYDMIVHAELNAVLQGSRTGTRLEGATIYATFFPCATCMGAIIQAGLSRVVTTDAIIPDRWQENMATARAMAHQAYVELYFLPSAHFPKAAADT